MVYAYIRFSTSSQDEIQQIQAINEWCDASHIGVDEFVKDEGVSGGVSYVNRHLFGLVRRMGEGDTLLVSELSRLGRSMADISKLLSEELKPKGIRLVVIKMGIDINCAKMRAQDDFLFSALSFAAQIEKELIQTRTQSAIDARKEAIKAEGGFISKSGRWCTKLGRKKGADTRTAVIAAGEAVHGKAMDWRKHSELYDFVERCVMNGTPRSEILAEASRKYDRNPEVWGTREGKRLTKGTLSRWIKEMQCGI